MWIGAFGMVVLAVTIVAAIVYAVATIDANALVLETDRATAAVAATVTEGVIPDAALAERLSRDFVLDGARFTTSAVLRPGELAVPVTTEGRIGLLAWMPRRPGTDIFVTLAPLRLAASGALLLLIGFILYQFYLLTRELEVRHQEAAELANTDMLTGLCNRMVFGHRLEAAFAGAPGSLDRFALLYIDLDGFKRVNDTLGHSAGDEVLRMVGERLAAFGETGDTVARLGGDEFGLIRADSARHRLAALAGDIQRSLAAPFQVGDIEVIIGASIGIALGPLAASPEALVEAADRALYRAKSEGGTFAFAEDALAPVRRPPRAAA